MSNRKKRVLILGGGFGGVYTAMHLQKRLELIPNWEIVIINRENYFVYQPMLAEIVGGSLGILDTISPIHRLVPKAHLITREIEEIILDKKQVVISPKFTHSIETVDYDHIVFAVGNVTNFRETTGLYEHAMPFKNLADAIRIRNHLIDVIETAQVTQDPELRKQLLTFVVGGGGFSGTEIVAEINDLIRKINKRKKYFDPNEIRVILVHSKEELMEKELSKSLSRYAAEILKKKGVEIRFHETLKVATPHDAILGSGERIPCKTIISTVPTSPNPIIEALNLPKEKGRLRTDSTMLVLETDHVWALGDCARIPIDQDNFCPPTAQFAIREAKLLAENIVRTILGKERKQFFFKSLGMLGALGHHSAVAELFGKIKLSGLLAWLMWRAVYWIKLPGLARKIKVAFSWILDAIFPIEMVQLKMAPSQGIAKLHFEPGEEIFHEGNVGDFLYIITEGAVEVIKGDKVVANLRKGEFFGEIALLNQIARTATIRCIQPTDVLALRKSDFGMLISNFKELRETFEKTENERMSK